MRDILTPFEKSEIKAYQSIWTIGKIRVKSSEEHSRSDGKYHPYEGEQLGYRYIVQKLLGNGAFGQVLKCTDVKENREVAIKITKNTQ